VHSVSALAAVEHDGLWQRVHMYRRVTPASVTGFAALYCAAPLLNHRATSDIVLLLARRR
jgi:hypothetical protein